MQSTATRKNSYTIEVNVKESGVELEKAKQHVLEEIRTKGKVKGFKQGSHIPDAVIVREYGETFIERQAIDHIVEKLYPKILKKENLLPIAPGTITAVKSTDPLEFTLEIETLPEIEIDVKKLDTIKVKKTTTKVTSDEVDLEIEAIKTRFTHFHEAGSHSEDGADTSHLSIENGDRVTITAQGYDKKGGVAITETAVPSYPLVIGSGSFIPGFEEKLIGAKNGDEVAFDITFPADYHSEEFKGRKVHFTASIEKIEKPHTPEFTEEFIEKLRGKKTDLAGLKEIIKGELSVKKENEARNKDEDSLMTQILEIAKIEVGPSLLSNEVNQIFKEHSANLEQQGYNIKMYLEHVKKSEEGYKEEVVKPEAERRLKAELILRKIKEIKGTEATEEEVKTEVEKVISQYENTEVVARLKEKLVPGDAYYEDIKNRVTYRKVVDGFWA
ncbi:trigger factor [Candidatus Gracilibacteria bacterium]|nr:trigger factor [Candidatus Gracilibacteria bacterium]